MNTDARLNVEACGCDDRLPELSLHTNLPGQPSLRYRLGVHSSFLRRMMARLARQPNTTGQRPLTKLTTRAVNDPSLALLDAAATLADLLTFYQERIANEGFLSTATERRSVLELARAIGYELKPGVAATVLLAFTLDDNPQAQEQVLIPAGTQIQSIPVKPGELPQTFETSTEFLAHRAWNALHPRSTRPQELGKGATRLYLAGVDTHLQPGDYLLLVGSEREQDPISNHWDLRRILTVTTYPTPSGGYTVVTWSPGLGSNQPHMLPSARPQAYALRRSARRFGYNAPDWRLMPAEVKREYTGNRSPPPSEWPGFAVDGSQPRLELDAVYPTIVPGSWIVLLSPDYTELYRVRQNAIIGVANFALAGQVTQLTLDTTENLARFARRTTLVLAESDLLSLATEPILDPVTGKQIEVAGMISNLAKDQPLIISGKVHASDEQPTSVVVFVETVTIANGFTTITLRDQGLGDLSLIRSTTVIFANVIAATHGETRAEPAGSGDSSQPYQHFKLKKSPLTFVSAPVPNGIVSSLTVRVNGVEWTATPSLFLAGPDEECYTVRIADDGTATIRFGDGEHGARLPTGQENVTVAYRVGIGQVGKVGAGALTLLKTRPPGVRSVTNPLPARGAEDPETLADARAHAPQTVLTLDRIVSLQDFTDFAQAFAGIGKAQATAFRAGEQTVIHVTIADASGDTVAATDVLLTHLRAAIDSVRDPAVLVTVAGFARRTFRLKATVQYHRRYREADVRTALIAALQTAFSFPMRNFGQPVTAAEVMAVMQPVAGVVAIDLDELAYMDDSTSTQVTLLPAYPARQIGTTILPAELLLLDPDGIDLKLSIASALR